MWIVLSRFGGVASFLSHMSVKVVQVGVPSQMTQHLDLLKAKFSIPALRVNALLMGRAV